jgi:hypothetical protein
MATVTTSHSVFRTSGLFSPPKEANIRPSRLDFFQYLDMAEVTSAMLVCRNWRNIVSNRPDLSAKVAHYFVVKQHHILFSNMGIASSADYYLAGESHSDPRCRLLTGRLISQLASHHHVIALIEGSPSTKVVETSHHFLMEKFRIHPSLSNNICFMGWDIENLKEALGNDFELQNCLEKQLINKRRIAEDILQQMHNLCPDDVSKFSELTDEQIRKYSKLQRRLVKLTNDADFFFAKWEKNASTEERIRSTFPQRTSSMSRTLEFVETMRVQGKFTGKVVLHSGASHLRTSSNKAGIAEYRLDKLYATLAKLNAMVIIPNFLSK